MLLDYAVIERLHVFIVTILATLSLVIVSHFNSTHTAEESSISQNTYPIVITQQTTDLFTVPAEPNCMQVVDTVEYQPVATTKFEPVEMYVHTVYGSLNVRKSPDADSDIIGTLKAGDKIKVLTDPEASLFAKVQFNDQTAYVHSDYVSTEKYVPPVIPVPKSGASGTVSAKKRTVTYTAGALSRQLGAVIGPSGKETYYNLNMNKVVNRLKSMGISGDYWIREDGCKMYGDHILVAANLDLHPRGSIVQTSLGTGIVADTGTFAASDANQIDIATTW